MMKGCTTFTYRGSSYGDFLLPGLTRPSGLIIFELPYCGHAYRGCQVDMAMPNEFTWYGVSYCGLIIYSFRSWTDAASVAGIIESMMPLDKPIEWYLSFDSDPMRHAVQRALNLEVI